MIAKPQIPGSGLRGLKTWCSLIFWVFVNKNLDKCMILHYQSQIEAMPNSSTNLTHEYFQDRPIHWVLFRKYSDGTRIDLGWDEGSNKYFKRHSNSRTMVAVSYSRHMTRARAWDWRNAALRHDPGKGQRMAWEALIATHEQANPEIVQVGYRRPKRVDAGKPRISRNPLDTYAAIAIWTKE